MRVRAGSSCVWFTIHRPSIRCGFALSSPQQNDATEERAIALEKGAIYVFVKGYIAFDNSALSPE
jgi:hypothetical protein